MKNKSIEKLAGALGEVQAAVKAEYEPEGQPMLLGPLVKYAPEMLASLKALLARHDTAVSHLRYDGRYSETPARGRQKYVHDRGSRRPTRGAYNVFCMVGPEGMGYYPCWCNPHRDLLAKIEKESRS